MAIGDNAMDEMTLGQLKNCRNKAELEACKDAILIIASNMYYDDKITNSQYNDICGALIEIRDVLENVK